MNRRHTTCIDYLLIKTTFNKLTIIAAIDVLIMGCSGEEVIVAKIIRSSPTYLLISFEEYVQEVLSQIPSICTSIPSQAQLARSTE